MGKCNLFWNNSSYQYFLIGTPEASMLSGDCVDATTGCQCHFDHTGVAQVNTMATIQRWEMIENTHAFWCSLQKSAR